MRADPFRIVEHPGRMQPYTVWFRAEVIGFFSQLASAERRIKQERNTVRLQLAAEAA